MKIEFKDSQVWNGLLDVVKFRVEVNGVRLTCAISKEVLEDNYSGMIGQLLDVFLRHRSRIEKKAEALIRASRYEPDGSIFIRSNDGA